MTSREYDAVVFVHCRTGSLEIILYRKINHNIVHRRTGSSLETGNDTPLIVELVHCRTGSLEKLGSIGNRSAGVHCRTGSLEMKSAAFMRPILFTAVQAA